MRATRRQFNTRVPDLQDLEVRMSQRSRLKPKHLRRPEALFVLPLQILVIASGACAGPTPQLTEGAILSFDESETVTSNHQVPGGRPLPNPAVCGQVGTAFMGEFKDADKNALQNPKVPFEWADIADPIGSATNFRPRRGRRPHYMYASGQVVAAQIGQRDVMFAHPFGTDLSIDVNLDPAYRELLVHSEMFPPPSGPMVPVDPTRSEVDHVCVGQQCIRTFHVELERGLWPHTWETSSRPWQVGALWFRPVPGDRIAVVGNYIMDCGHPADYTSEIHPPAVLAFAYVADDDGERLATGTKTVSYAFANPYRVSQLYQSENRFVNDFANEERFQSDDSRPFPQHLYQEIEGVDIRGSQHLAAHALLEAVGFESLSWYVCAPTARPPSAVIAFKWKFVARTGVVGIVTPDDALGCAHVAVVMTSDYRPLRVPHFDTTWPWNGRVCNDENDTKCVSGGSINDGASLTFGQAIDVRTKIKEGVNAGPASNVAIHAVIDRDPIVDRYNPLAVNPFTVNGSFFESDIQPFPFYGTVQVWWRLSARGR